MSIRTRHGLFAALILLLFVTGCSGLFPYKNDLNKNLAVKTRTDSGSLFSGVKARVDIYSVDSSCNVTYRGTVDLKYSEVDIGLPPGEPNYLNFVFSSSNFFANTNSSTGFDLYFKVRPGYQYLAEASYIDGIYDVILKEKKRGSKSFLEVPYGECNPNK